MPSLRNSNKPPSITKVEGSRKAPRILAKLAYFALALYGALHITSIAYYSIRDLPASASKHEATALSPEDQVLVSAITRILTEDGIPEAERWAQAILRAAPTRELGYIALVITQIRRESHFLTKDIEWVFDSMVPDLVHEWGVTDPVNTVGPMQVQRLHLRRLFEDTIGRPLDLHEVKELAGTIKVGVATCVAVLDELVLDYYPDRRIRGWLDFPGAAGLAPAGSQNLASAWHQPDQARRESIAAIQKMLSDLTNVPLALDGIPGDRTVEIARQFAMGLPQLDREQFLGALMHALESDSTHDLSWTVPFQSVSLAWQKIFGGPAPNQIAPRISHDPRLAFVFADFNSGRNASRHAALQALLSELLGIPLDADGKVGAKTRSAMASLFGEYEVNPKRSQDFLELLQAGRKIRWVTDQAGQLARRVYQSKYAEEAPEALVPDFWHSGLRQSLKGAGLVSLEGYVSGSASFFEGYYVRLATYSGEMPSRPTVGLTR